MLITACLAVLVCIVAFNSSVMSPASNDLVHEFGISKEVSVLATSLFVLGFAFGPASEVLGRKYPLSVGIFLFAVFSLPVAVAKNVATIFACRFLSGVFGAAPLDIICLRILPPLPFLPIRVAYADPDDNPRSEAVSPIFGNPSRGV